MPGVCAKPEHPNLWLCSPGSTLWSLSDGSHRRFNSTCAYFWSCCAQLQAVWTSYNQFKRNNSQLNTIPPGYPAGASCSHFCQDVPLEMTNCYIEPQSSPEVPRWKVMEHFTCPPAGVDEASATCQNAIGLKPGEEMGWPNSHFAYVQTGAKAVTWLFKAHGQADAARTGPHANLMFDTNIHFHLALLWVCLIF